MKPSNLIVAGLWLAAACALLFGCAATPIKVESSRSMGAASDSASEAAVHFDAILRTASALWERVKAERPAIEQIVWDAGAGKTNTVDLRASLKQATDGWVEVSSAFIAEKQQHADDKKSADQRLDDEHNHWLGYKTRSRLPWVIGGVIACVIAYEVLTRYLTGASLAVNGAKSLCSLLFKT